VIPLSDENPTIRPAVATWLLLAGLGAVWVVVQGAGFDERLIRSVCNLGMVPGELTRMAPIGAGVPLSEELSCVVDREGINALTPVLSMFLHGGWGHLLGNALFLWVFGNNIEDVMGGGRFLLFYLLCGLGAAASHVLVDPRSILPTVGASGAISGVMGGYLLLFPSARVRMLFIFGIFFRVIPLPAWAVLLWWFALQVLAGLPQLAGVGDLSGGVAVWAHVGGFVAGVLLVRAFIRPALVAEREAMLLRHRRMGIT
jgi:membrane associated rhomboid family serine protease